MINNRQAGRRRGRGGQQQRSQGGNPGRQDTGNRIDNRARGNAAQLLEKYKTLARDAQMQGDRVNVEYYLQFADHYFRVLAETRARFEENGGAPNGRRIQGATLDEDEQDDEEDGERIEQPRPELSRGDQSRSEPFRSDQSRNDQLRNEQPRSDQQRGDQPRGGQNGQQGGYRNDDRPDGDRGHAQNAGQNGRDGGAYRNGASEQRGEGPDQGDRQRGRVNGPVANDEDYERPSESRGERPARGERHEQQARAPRVARPQFQPQVQPARELQPQPAPAFERAETAEQPSVAEAEAPRRGRGRPRRVVAPAVEQAGPEDGGPEDRGLALDRLPPSLNLSAVAPASDAAAPDGETIETPRRRRGRPPASASRDAG